MHPSLLLLSLISILPLSAVSWPPLHQLRFSNNRLHPRNSDTPPQEYIEITRPLPFDSLNPSCTLPVFSHSFGNTIDLPPTASSYFPPRDCKWSYAVLQFSGAANGSQYDRIAAVWLSGAELLRTSTPQSTPDGIFWNFRKDVSRYAFLLRQSNITLSVMLENVVDDVYAGSYRVNLTFLYYDISSKGTTNQAVNLPLSLLPRNQKSTIRKLKDSLVSLEWNKSLELNENPADLILPISAVGDEGFWFKIKGESDAVYQGIQIPLNTYRAVIEVYVSSHGNDELWYTNPPDYYIESNGLSTQSGHGAYREVLVKLDDNVVGSVIPFPVIYAGGINPVFWEPIVSIGAFDFPSYEFELTPFLGLLLDGKVHFFGLSVADAISYWLVDANLHLWLDDKADKVQAGPIKYNDPNTCVERDLKFEELDGDFEIEAEKDSQFSGWVKSSAGNFTTIVTSKLDFENTINFKKNGTRKSVKQEVKVKNKVELKPPRGDSISLNVERKYPFKLKMSTIPGSAPDTYLMSVELEHSLKEDKEIGKFESKLENKQESEGWLFVQDLNVLDHGFLSGGGSTSQNYHAKDSFGCYTRKVSVDSGAIETDTEKFLCAPADS